MGMETMMRGRRGECNGLKLALFDQFDPAGRGGWWSTDGRKRSHLHNKLHSCRQRTEVIFDYLHGGMGGDSS